jgi:ethanolamine utilization protein EutN
VCARVGVFVRLCRVIGSVWGGKEALSLAQGKLLRVQEVSFVAGTGTLDMSTSAPPVAVKNGIVIALDQLGAGVGEYVLVAHGSRVRDLTVGASLPVKDVVVAIIDAAEVNTSLFPEVMP